MKNATIPFASGSLKTQHPANPHNLPSLCVLTLSMTHSVAPSFGCSKLQPSSLFWNIWFTGFTIFPKISVVQHHQVALPRAQMAANSPQQGRRPGRYASDLPSSEIPNGMTTSKLMKTDLWGKWTIQIIQVWPMRLWITFCHVIILCTCVYVYISAYDVCHTCRIHLYVCIHTYSIYIYIYMYVHILMYLFLHSYVYAYVFVYIYIYILVYVICICILSSIHTVHICTHNVQLGRSCKPTFLCCRSWTRWGADATGHAMKGTGLSIHWVQTPL